MSLLENSPKNKELHWLVIATSVLKGLFLMIFGFDTRPCPHSHFSLASGSFPADYF